MLQLFRREAQWKSERMNIPGMAYAIENREDHAFASSLTRYFLQTKPQTRPIIETLIVRVSQQRNNR